MTKTPSSADTPESRPRPQYGEYATAEEQQARIRRPDASDALSAGIAPERAAVVSKQAPKPGPEGRQSSPRTPQRRADVVATLVLLGLGLLHVLLVAPMLFVFDRVIVFMLDYYELDSARLTDTTDLRLAGTLAAILMIVVWLLATASSWWSLRQRRVSFWIPLLAALVSTVAVNLVLDGPLTREPAIRDLLNQVMGMGAGG